MNITIKNECQFGTKEEYIEYLRNMKNKKPEVEYFKMVYYNALEDWANELLEEKRDT